MDKNAIRTLVQSNITKMSEEEKKGESEFVCKKLIESLSGREFEIIVGYQAFTDEVDISGIHKWCKDIGKSMLFIPQSTQVFVIPQNSILLVPGRAFTKDGQRIGRGSGYYDKLIAEYPDCKTIGVCFQCQVFEKLPQDTWDKKMDEVVFPSIVLE